MKYSGIIRITPILISLFFITAGIIINADHGKAQSIPITTPNTIWFETYDLMSHFMSNLDQSIDSSPNPDHMSTKSTDFPTAEDVSRRWLTRHPNPRDSVEKQIIAVMDYMQDNQARGMGNVLPEDGRLMRMLTESLEASRWGMCITRKMR
jgi:hypothetical protein